MRKIFKYIFTSKIRTWLAILAITVAGSAILITPFYRLAYVTGDSMAPTLRDGQLALLERTQVICRDDIVIAHDGISLITKRAIGVSGDTIEIRQGKIYVNNKKIEGDYDIGFITDAGKHTYVPSGYVWLIGDNKSMSWHGMLPLKDVEGVVIWH
tara:strand:- start:61 stop:525 length:465 start_codon:yes stop_codon:yes gene_type:complete